MKVSKVLVFCGVLILGWVAVVNAAPTVVWTVDVRIAALSDSSTARAVVLAAEPNVADVVWINSVGTQSYTQFINDAKSVDAEAITSTYGLMLDISRRYDGKLRTSARTNYATAPNFAEFTREGTGNWTYSAPAAPALIATWYSQMGGYDVDPCTGLAAFMIWDATDTVRYYRETSQGVWTDGVDVQVGDEYWYTGFCDFLITPDGAPIGAYKMNSVTAGVHAGELDPCGGAITSVIPGSGSAAWTGQSMTVAADGTIYHLDMRNGAAPKVQVAKSEDNGATWTLLGIPASTYRAWAQGYDVAMAVAPDESQLAVLAFGPGATDYTTTLHISEPNAATSVEIGVEWYTDPCWLPGARDLDYPDVAYDPEGNLYVVYCRDTGDPGQTGLRLLSNVPLTVDANVPFTVDADLDDDGDVDFNDWIILVGNWLESTGDVPCAPLLAGSIDEDCDVDLHDHALLVANWTGSFSNEQGPFTLVSGGANPANIIVNSTDPVISNAAIDLAAKLEEISGPTFNVTSGDGGLGIIVGLESDFTAIPFTVNFSDGPDPSLATPEFLREQYIIRSTGRGIWLIGKTPLAVQHAVWDLLYQFGYRQYFPRSTWEHIPSNDTLTIDVDKEETPDYRARRIWYNGSYLLPFPEWDNATSLLEWYARNRMAKGFVLTSNHEYTNMIQRNQSDFNANPQYYALVGGARQNYHGDVKLCIDNPDVVAISSADAVSEIIANPGRDTVSRDPSDGGNWCECDGVYHATHNPDSTDCTGNFSSISDRVLYLSNQAAQALVGAGYTDKYVGQYAYNYHADPPQDYTVHSNVIVSVANGFLSGNFSFPELLQGWVNKGANKLGVYDYFSVYQWDLSKPRSARAAYPRDLASKTRDYYNLKARFHSAESSDSWAPHGVSYYVLSRVLWDVDEADNVEAMIDAFVTDMFGPAYTPMKDFFDLINKDKVLRSDGNLLTNMYYYLDEAVTAAGSNQAVLDRIYEMVKYTRFFELRTIYDDDTGNVSNKEAMLTFVYRIRMNSLVHAFRIWSVFGLSGPALNDPGYYLKDSTAINEAEVLGFLSNGRSTFGDPPDPYPSFLAEEKIYSTDLVPAAAPMGLTHPAGTGELPRDSQRAHHFFLWVDPNQTTITFDIESNPTGDACKMKLFHSDHGNDPVDTLNFDSPAGSTTLRLTLNTSYTGLHEAALSGATGQSVVDWSPAGVSDGVLSTLQSSPYQASAHLDESFVLTRFYAGYWRQFFYVPAGTTTIGFWATDPVGEIRDGGNSIIASYSNGSIDGWYEVAVPGGQDDKVWHMIANRGVRLMMTVPPYFAKTVDDLLLPREVVYGVSPGAATNPSPANGAPSVALDADLSWTVGQATATQKLYLDTVNPPTSLEADLSGSQSSYDLGTLDPATTYYWRLGPNNINGPTAGTVWSFTTN